MQLLPLRLPPRSPGGAKHYLKLCFPANCPLSYSFWGNVSVEHVDARRPSEGSSEGNRAPRTVNESQLYVSPSFSLSISPSFSLLISFPSFSICKLLFKFSHEFRRQRRSEQFEIRSWEGGVLPGDGRDAHADAPRPFSGALPSLQLSGEEQASLLTTRTCDFFLLWNY